MKKKNIFFMMLVFLSWIDFNHITQVSGYTLTGIGKKEA